MIPNTFKEFFFVIFSVVLGVSAQDTFAQMGSESPMVDTIEHCILDYYSTLTTAEIQEFQDDNKKEWLRYMPTVGLTYTPTGAPRPGVSIGSALIYTSYKDKKAKRNKIKGIQIQNELRADTEVRRFKKMIQQLHLMHLELAARTKIFEIDHELFEFYTKQYESQDLAPSAYLLKKKDYYIKVEELRKAKLAIELHRLEVEEVGRCGS